MRGLTDFAGEFPVAAMAEKMLTAGKGQIRALATSAGNPALSNSNGVQLDKALFDLDYMVSIDFHLSETTRRANIILPPTGPLGHDNYDLTFHALAGRDTAKYYPALFKPDKDARHDRQIAAVLLEF